MTEHHPPTATRARRKLFVRSEAGAAMVEFALVILPFTMLLYGLIYYGMALATKQRVTNAAAEGARAAVGAANPGEAQSKAKTRIDGLLDGPHPRYQVFPVAAPCDAANSGGPQCITVTVSWDWDNHPAVPAAPGLKVFAPDSVGSKAVVQYSG